MLLFFRVSDIWRTWKRASRVKAGGAISNGGTNYEQEKKKKRGTGQSRAEADKRHRICRAGRLGESGVRRVHKPSVQSGDLYCSGYHKMCIRDSDSPALEESFRKYGKSQLQEMLYLTDEQLEDVRPDMTVKDIRNIRKPVEKKAEEAEPKPELRQGRKPTEEELSLIHS